jgi:hypothetical protein
MTKYNIRISAEHLRVIKEHIANSKKIQAIKHARNHGKQFPPTESGIDPVTEEIKYDHRVGLRSAKDAVEVLMGSKREREATALFTPVLRILSIKIETEDGICEVDVDNLRLRLLDGMSEMSLNEMAHMADLAAYVANWQNADSEDS